MNTTQNGQAFNLEELLSRPTRLAMKQLRIRFYFALFASNLAMFALMLPTQTHPAPPKLTAALGNVTLRLPLNLLISLNQNQKTHVTLVDKEQHVHVSTAWVWDEDPEEKSDALSQTARKLYSIEVQPGDAARLIQMIHSDLQENILMAIPPIPLTHITKENPYVEILL